MFAMIWLLLLLNLIMYFLVVVNLFMLVFFVLFVCGSTYVYFSYIIIYMCFGCLFVFLFKYFCMIYNIYIYIYSGFYIYLYIFSLTYIYLNIYIYIPLSFADLCFLLFISGFVAVVDFFKVMNTLIKSFLLDLLALNVMSMLDS